MTERFRLRSIRLVSAQQRGLLVASVIFALFALAHLVRLVAKTRVTVGSQQIGLWVSVVALIVGAVLSLWFCRLSR